MSTTIPAALEDAPSRTVLVYLLLRDRDVAPATKQDLVEASRRSPATVRRALRELEQLDLVEATVNRSDRRRRLYCAKSAS